MELDQHGGRLTVQSFPREALIDELTVTVPVLLGKGRPLFGALPGDVALELVESRHGPVGFVQSRWRVRPCLGAASA